MARSSLLDGFAYGVLNEIIATLQNCLNNGHDMHREAHIIQKRKEKEKEKETD